MYVQEAEMIMAAANTKVLIDTKFVIAFWVILNCLQKRGTEVNRFESINNVLPIENHLHTSHIKHVFQKTMYNH